MGEDGTALWSCWFGADHPIVEGGCGGVHARPDQVPGRLHAPARCAMPAEVGTQDLIIKARKGMKDSEDSLIRSEKLVAQAIEVCWASLRPCSSMRAFPGQNHCNVFHPRFHPSSMVFGGHSGPLSPRWVPRAALLQMLVCKPPSRWCCRQATWQQGSCTSFDIKLHCLSQTVVVKCSSIAMQLDPPGPLPHCRWAPRQLRRCTTRPSSWSGWWTTSTRSTSA